MVYDVFFEAVIRISIFIVLVFVLPIYFSIKSANKEDKHEEKYFGDTSRSHLKNTIIGLFVAYIFLASIFSISIYDEIKTNQYYADVYAAIRSSDCFSYVDYDSDEETLLVEFRDSGYRYKYYFFTKEEFDKFVFSESMGRYYNANIKGQYPSMRID